MNQENILFIVDHWHADLGGRKKVFLSILKMLSQEFANIKIVNLELRIKNTDLKDKNPNEGLADNIQLNTYFLNKKSIISIIKAFIFLIRQIKNTKTKVIITGGAGPHTNALFTAISRLIWKNKIKIIALEQGNSKAILSREPKIIQKISKRLFKKINIIISPSKEMSLAMSDYFFMPKEKFIYIHNFIDLERINRLKQEKTTENIFLANYHVISSVCRLDVKQKNIIGLLEAFQMVTKEIGNALLIIIGEGSDRKIIEKKIQELQLIDKVILMGHQANPYKYIAQSELFVLSTFNEGLPLVLLEAMACACPVISSNCDFGPREIIEDGKSGILVPVNEPRPMADAMIKVINNRNLQTYLINNALQTINNFSEDIAAKKYKEIIIKTIDSDNYK